MIDFTNKSDNTLNKSLSVTLLHIIRVLTMTVKGKIKNPAVEKSVTIMQIQSPVMGRETFAVITDKTEDTVRGWINNGHVPTIKIGRRVLINIAKLQQICLAQD